MASIDSALTSVKRSLSSLIPEELIREAARQAGHVWRVRILDPVLTVQLLVLQALFSNTSLTHLRHLGASRVKASAMCQARARLPVAVLQELLDQMCQAAGASGLFHGHKLWLADGSSAATPDTAVLQKSYPQPSGQRKGCGFPLIKILGLFDAASGMLVKMILTSLHSHEQSIACQLHDQLSAGDVVLGDRGFCSYWHIALLHARQACCIFRMHQRQIVNFRSGRRHRGKGERGRPTSRWIKRLGRHDQLVKWIKPANRPSWMSVAMFESMPATLLVREVRYTLSNPGYRSRCVTIATTLQDASECPKDEIVWLYGVRWEVETHFRQLKTTMKMRTLKCKSVEGVKKELLAFALAYNLTRSAMNQAARRQAVDIERISFIDTLRWLVSQTTEESMALIENPLRPDRYEPRAVKRRAKQYDLMNRPRTELRSRLSQQTLTA